MFVSEEIGVVRKDAVVSCSRNRNAESSVHVVCELKLEAETHWLIEFPA